MILPFIAINLINPSSISNHYQTILLIHCVKLEHLFITTSSVRSWLLSESIFTFICYCHLNIFQSSLAFHGILECTSHNLSDTFFSMILVLWLALLCSSLTTLIMSNPGFVSMIFQSQGTIGLLTSWGLAFTVIWGLPFQSSSLLLGLCRKEHHVWRSRWDSPNQLEPNWHSYWRHWVKCFNLLIKYHLELEKLWCLRNALNNSHGYWLLLKYAIYTIKMEFSMLNPLSKTARTSSKLSHFLELLIIIRMPLHKWPALLWFMFLWTGANMVLIIFTLGYCYETCCLASQLHSQPSL